MSKNETETTDKEILRSNTCVNIVNIDMIGKGDRKIELWQSSIWTNKPLFINIDSLKSSNCICTIVISTFHFTLQDSKYISIITTAVQLDNPSFYATFIPILQSRSDHGSIKCVARPKAMESST